MALSAYLKYIYQSQLLHTHGTLLVPVCNTLCGVGIHLTGTRKFWYRTPSLLNQTQCVQVLQLQKALAVSKSVVNLLCDLDSEAFSTHFSLIVNTSYKAG